MDFSHGSGSGSGNGSRALVTESSRSSRWSGMSLLGDGGGGGMGLRRSGMAPRLLHEAVYDALTMTSPFRSRCVGAGSWSYEMVGGLLPFWLSEVLLQARGAGRSG